MIDPHGTSRLSDYLDGELASVEAASVEHHLAACADCRATVAALREIITRARGLVDSPPPQICGPASRHGWNPGLPPAATRDAAGFRFATPSAGDSRSRCRNSRPQASH